jgi:hypothetical protein
MSGLPARCATCSRKRKPRRCRKHLVITSGWVCWLRIACMHRRRCSAVRLSGITSVAFICPKVFLGSGFYQGCARATSVCAKSPPNPTPRPSGPRPSPWQGRVKIAAAQPLFLAQIRPHIGHCQGMVEAWVGSCSVSRSVSWPGIRPNPDAK